MGMRWRFWKHQLRTMGVQGELPERKNRRGGAGWWMDPDGVWQPPEAWPEDTPPVDGWERGIDGRWAAPPSAPAVEVELSAASVLVEERPAAPKTQSRQAQADRKAMFLVVGALGGAALLLAGALILITQAGALGNGDEPPSTQPEVIVAAETDQVRAAQREAVAVSAPIEAEAQLEQLEVRTEVVTIDLFDPADWTPDESDCLDTTEQVLVERSKTPVIWADQLECVPDTGRWVDRYLGREIRRTIEADVELLVPASVAYVSGGHTWSDATRKAYAADTVHPASHHIVSSAGGHNPRSADPSSWMPSNRDTWCAYAVDWISVKTRWSLSVTEAERAALAEMLESCADPGSDGADPDSMLLTPLPAPTIELVDADG